MKDVIHISDPIGPRFELALDQIESGQGFEFQSVWFRKDQDHLRCEAVSSVSAESLTEAAAIALIHHAQSAFDNLCKISKRFNLFASGTTVRYCVIEDYGMGTAVIVELVGTEFVWS